MKLKMTGKSSSWVVVILVVLCLAAAVVSIALRDFSGRSGSGLSESYDYDLSQYEQIDPALILYSQIRRLRYRPGSIRVHRHPRR